MKQAGTGKSATVIHRRPALIEEIQWQSQSIDLTGPGESTKDVVFCFRDGRLFRIAVKYDHYDTEGLTSEDMIGAISATYGTAIAISRGQRYCPSRNSIRTTEYLFGGTSEQFGNVYGTGHGSSANCVPDQV